MGRGFQKTPFLVPTIYKLNYISVKSDQFSNFSFHHASSPTFPVIFHAPPRTVMLELLSVSVTLNGPIAVQGLGANLICARHYQLQLDAGQV